MIFTRMDKVGNFRVGHNIRKIKRGIRRAMIKKVSYSLDIPQNGSLANKPNKNRC